jgi:hypothetical protein
MWRTILLLFETSKQGLVDGKIVQAGVMKMKMCRDNYLLGVIEANRNEDECMYVVRFKRTIFIVK